VISAQCNSDWRWTWRVRCLPLSISSIFFSTALLFE